MTLEDEIAVTFRVNTKFENGGCLVVLFGELDWIKDIDVMTQCFNEVLAHQAISSINIDCRDLFFIRNDEVLGAYFMTLMISLKEMSKKRQITLLIHFRSKRQIAVLNFRGHKIWRQFKSHFIFDNPD